MDIQSLQIFVEVMRRGSFAEVARTHNVDPSTISRTIQSLEEDLGLRLFQRTTRRLTPTEAGEVYYQHVEPVVEELLRARESARATDQVPRGHLRISAPVTYGQVALIPHLPEFGERFPEISLDIQLTDRYVNLVEERFDVALRIGALADSSMIAVRLCEMPFALCATPKYLKRCGRPQSLEDLHQHTLLAFPPDNYRVSWKFRDRKGEVQELLINPRLKIPNGMALYRCALGDMGIGLLMQFLAKEEIARGRLVNLFEEYDITPTEFDQSAWVLYPSRDYLAAKVRVFVDFMREKARSPA